MYLKFVLFLLTLATTQCNVIKDENIEEKISTIQANATKLNEIFNSVIQIELEKPYYYEAMKNLVNQKMAALETRFFKQINETIIQARQTGNAPNISIDSVYYFMFAETFDDPEFIRLSKERTDKLVTDENTRTILYDKTKQMYSKYVEMLKDASKLFASEPIYKHRKEKGDVMMANLKKYMMDITNDMYEVLRVKGIPQEEAKKIVSGITFNDI